MSFCPKCGKILTKASIPLGVKIGLVLLFVFIEMLADF